MDEEPTKQVNEPGDGDWCLVDLSGGVAEEATKVAHALGMDFHAFMCEALEEKLARLRGDEELGRKIGDVGWEPLLKG